MFRGFFNFLLFSSIYIALVALLMVWESEEIMGLAIDRGNYFGFVFFSTICSYNFHWYLTPGSEKYSERILWGRRRRRLQLMGCCIGLLGAAWYGLPLIHHWLPLAGAVVLTFLYSAPKVPHATFRWLKKIAIGKTIFLAFVWMYVTTLLPYLIADSAKVNFGEVALLCVYRFFLIYAICILFDHRDREEDRAEGIRSLITSLEEPHLDKLYYGSLIVSAACALALAPDLPLFVLFSLLAAVAVVWAVKNYAQTHHSDYVYYFQLDGLMAFSALIHLLWRLAGGI